MSGLLSGGSIRVLWDASDAAEVSITGGVAAWTVNGSAVTFPYTLSSSTTFETAHSGTYTVSVKHHGYEIAGTPDGTREVQLRFGEQHIFEPTVDGPGHGASSVATQMTSLINDADSAPGAALRETFAPKVQSLAAAFASANGDPQPAIPGTVPTITYSGSGGLARVVSAAGFGQDNGAVSILGQRGTWDTTNGKLEVNAGLITALDFYVHDSDVEFGYVEQTTGGSRVWVWVDGAPVHAVPAAAPLSVSAGANIVGKIAFGSVARRRVTIWASNMNAWKWVRTNATGVLSAAQRNIRVAFVGDSWWGGSSQTPGVACASSVIARTFNVNPHIEAIGGTGYLAGSSPFGDATRVARVAAFDPDLILFMGSINDSNAGLQAAATAAYDAYADACPGVPLVVFGPQPSNAADTISTARAETVASVKAAAEAHPAVIAFHDQIGTAAGVAPAAWVSGGTYTTGDLVTYQGSVYEWRGATGGAGPLTPAASGSWTLKTWVMTGTGYDTTPASNGSRDVALGNDNVHPTPTGSMALGILQAMKVRESLRAS